MLRELVADWTILQWTLAVAGYLIIGVVWTVFRVWRRLAYTFTIVLWHVIGHIGIRNPRWQKPKLKPPGQRTRNTTIGHVVFWLLELIGIAILIFVIVSIGSLLFLLNQVFGKSSAGTRASS